MLKDLIRKTKSEGMECQASRPRTYRYVREKPSETRFAIPCSGDELLSNLKHANVHDSPGERVRCLAKSTSSPGGHWEDLGLQRARLRIVRHSFPFGR